ncbi:MAG: hypothetical protein H7Y09_03855, partial [Chitinophagaceae bacterium]|nr:hypothetical protein [Anaerolineae bacterium]
IVKQGDNWLLTEAGIVNATAGTHEASAAQNNLQNTPLKPETILAGAK